MRFSLFFFHTTQHREGDGQTEGNAVAAPSGGERKGRPGHAAGELWPHCELPSLKAGGEGSGERPTMGAGRRWALAGRGREEGASEKLWSGRGHEEETDGEHWPAEAPRGMARDGGTVGSWTSREFFFLFF